MSGNETWMIQYESTIRERVKQLLEGDERCLRMTYEAFATQNKELVREAGKVIGEYVGRLSTKQLIRVSERFREFTSLDWFIDWKNVDLKSKKDWLETDSDYQSVLILGSFHPNGYFREHCMELLESYPNSLVCLMLRTNDWVEAIREKAYVMALNKIRHCLLTELVPAIQVLEKLRHSGRIGRNHFGEIEQSFYEKMEEALEQVPLEKIHFCEFDSRKYIYRLFVIRKILTYQQMNMLLEWEKHSFCKQILIMGIFQQFFCTEEQIESYLTNKNGIVRRRALEYKYDRVKDSWLGLENMLLDKNKGVRGMTVFILQKHTDISVLDYYIEHLKDENPLPAMIGVGENGGRQEGKLLLPFLDTDHIKIVRTALEMLGRTLGMEGADIYLEYLQNEEPGIAKSAYKAIQCTEIRYGSQCIYNICIGTPYSHVRKYALLLLLDENSWNRLPYLLELYGKEEFEPYKWYIKGGIGWRDMYGSISAEHAERIKIALQKNAEWLPENWIKNIIFDLKFVTKK